MLSVDGVNYSVPAGSLRYRVSPVRVLDSAPDIDSQRDAADSPPYISLRTALRIPNNAKQDAPTRRMRRVKMEKFFLRDGRWACFPVFSQALRRPHRRDSRLWRFPYLRLDTLQNALSEYKCWPGGRAPRWCQSEIIGRKGLAPARPICRPLNTRVPAKIASRT